MSASFKCRYHSDVVAIQPTSLSSQRRSTGELHLRLFAFDLVHRHATTIHGRKCSSKPVVNVHRTPRIDKLAVSTCLVSGHRALRIADHTRAMFHINCDRLRDRPHDPPPIAAINRFKSKSRSDRLKGPAIRAREALWPPQNPPQRPSAPVRAHSRYPHGSNDRHRGAGYHRGYVFARPRVHRSK